MESEDGLVNELEASIHAEDMGVLRAAVSRAQARADAPRLTKHLQLALIVLAVRSATAAEDELLVCKRRTRTAAAGARTALSTRPRHPFRFPCQSR